MRYNIEILAPWFELSEAFGNMQDTYTTVRDTLSYKILSLCNYYDEISMSYMAYVITLENTEEPNLSYTIN